MRMDIHIHLKIKQYIRPYIVQIFIHIQQNMTSYYKQLLYAVSMRVYV